VSSINQPQIRVCVYHRRCSNLENGALESKGSTILGAHGDSVANVSKDTQRGLIDLQHLVLEQERVGEVDLLRT